MEIEIKYSESFEQHPEIVGKWVKEALKASEQFNPEKAKWSYSFAQKVNGIRIGDVVRKLSSSELDQERAEEQRKTVEQRVNEQINSVVGLSIKVNHAGFKREKALQGVPKLFSEKFGKLISDAEHKRLSEEERISKLTPEERQREEQELFNELSGMGGFFGLNVGPNGVSRIQPKKISYSIDQILDKVSRVGVGGLTDGEKKFLDDHSQKMNKS